ncbi:MAG: presenilin family intramembrane aspartyl protease PSH [Methanomassiliicoccales archaeon]
MAEKRPFFLPALAGAVLFVSVQLVAMLLVPQYESAGYRAFGPQGQSNPLIPLIYVAFLVLFTLFLLFIFRMGKVNAIRAFFIAVVSLSAIYVLFPVFALAFPTAIYPDFYASIAVMVIIAVALWAYPEWYVIDTWGFIMASGITAIFGISFGLLPALVLLTAMAIYDFIAVYKTKHMLDLAEGALDLNLPVMMMVPRSRSYSAFESKMSVKEERPEGREALFVGLGDMIIPGVLTVSSFSNLPTSPAIAGLPANILVAVACLCGALVGYAALMVLTSRGRAQAGLPLLNGGTAAGFFIAYFLIFHTLQLHFFI